MGFARSLCNTKAKLAIKQWFILGGIMLHSINNTNDINEFLDKTNSLHDGYIVEVKYNNNGISKINRTDLKYKRYAWVD